MAKDMNKVKSEETIEQRKADVDTITTVSGALSRELEQMKREKFDLDAVIGRNNREKGRLETEVKDLEKQRNSLKEEITALQVQSDAIVVLAQDKRIAEEQKQKSVIRNAQQLKSEGEALLAKAEKEKTDVNIKMQRNEEKLTKAIEVKQQLQDILTNLAKVQI